MATMKSALGMYRSKNMLLNNGVLDPKNKLRLIVRHRFNKPHVGGRLLIPGSWAAVGSILVVAPDLRKANGFGSEIEIDGTFEIDVGDGSIGDSDKHSGNDGDSNNNKESNNSNGNNSGRRFEKTINDLKKLKDEFINGSAIGKSRMVFEALGIVSLVRGFRKNNQHANLADAISALQERGALPSSEEIQEKFNDMMSKFSEMVNGWLQQRKTSEAIIKRQEAGAKRVEEIQKTLEMNKQKRVISRQVQLEKFSKKLNFQLATRKFDEDVVSRRKRMVESFMRSMKFVSGVFLKLARNIFKTVKFLKQTFDVFARYLSIVFIKPIKKIEMQFIQMGRTIITVLKMIADAMSMLSNRTATIQNGSTFITQGSAEQNKMPAFQNEDAVITQKNANSASMSASESSRINRTVMKEAGARQTNIYMNSNMPVNASIHNGMDMDTFLRQLSAGMDMAMRSSAEGVHL